MKTFFANLIIVAMLTQPAAGKIWQGETGDSRPMPNGSCPLDHDKLLAPFVEEKFRELQNNNSVSPNDELDGYTGYRQLPEQGLNSGDTPYAMDLWGRTSEHERIPPVDEQDHPDGTRDYRCIGRVVVTSDCIVKMVPLDFMDSEKLGEAANQKLREMEESGTLPEPDESGRVGVQVAVPTFETFTCFRPPPLLAF